MKPYSVDVRDVPLDLIAERKGGRREGGREGRFLWLSKFGKFWGKQL